MFNQNFIFSERKSVRIKRHMLFWLVWGVYFAMMHAASPFLKPKSSYFQNIPFTLAESFLMLIPQIVITYIIIYFVLPIYTERRKILMALVSLVVCWFFCCSLIIFMVKNVNPTILNWILPEKFLKETGRPPEVSFFMGLILAGKGLFTATALVIGLKYIKQWFLKEQRNIQLQKENTEAQLQLLTAQVHPHFLFNTLNNIYSQTQTESPKGSKMIMALSDMLRYILAEGSKSLVPLKKELMMIRDYINLERIRYGNKLDLHVSIPEETGNLKIAPLLLLPFIENCFKHGASKILRSPWINLRIDINDNILFMKLMNGKDTTLLENQSKSGTGIINVKKRLDLLYKDKYELQVIDEPEVFVVNLKLELVKEKVELTSLNEISNEPVYAHR